MKLATGTKLGKDFKKNNLSNCSKWLAIEYKKSDRSLIVTVFLWFIRIYIVKRNLDKLGFICNEIAFFLYLLNILKA